MYTPASISFWHWTHGTFQLVLKKILICIFSGWTHFSPIACKTAHASTFQAAPSLKDYQHPPKNTRLNCRKLSRVTTKIAGISLFGVLSVHTLRGVPWGGVLRRRHCIALLDRFFHYFIFVTSWDIPKANSHISGHSYLLWSLRLCFLTDQRTTSLSRYRHVPCFQPCHLTGYVNFSPSCTLEIQQTKSVAIITAS